jgi:hypothetical protein
VSGVTFFSLHLFILCGLLAWHIRGTLDRCADWIEPVTEAAATQWTKIFAAPEGTMPWLIAESMLLGILVSGPFLLVSGVGHILARLSAWKLPCYRFWTVTCLVSLVFATADLAVCLSLQPFNEEQDVHLRIQIVDETSAQPIAAAFVCLSDPFDDDPRATMPRALTDTSGRVRLIARFEVSGQHTAFQTIGSFSPWGRWLEVSAAGYRARRIPLIDVLGPFETSLQPSVHTVALARGKTPDDQFRDVAGQYRSGASRYSSEGFEIRPDGRFTWYSSSCTHHRFEYGSLSRRGDTIELRTVPHPGQEPEPRLALNYRATTWGNRLYFSSTKDEDLEELCRAALAPRNDPESRLMFRVYERRSDGKSVPAGLPDLPPKVWAKFLANELGRSSDSLFMMLTFRHGTPLRFFDGSANDY